MFVPVYFERVPLLIMAIRCMGEGTGKDKGATADFETRAAEGTK